MPGATLYAADVYGADDPDGGSSEAVIKALAWMARENVPVINISLVGPPNRALEKAIATLSARGFTIVASVGNDGPSAPPLYPAAYPQVVGVTGVDSRQKVLLEANQGDQVDFAARGADVLVSTPDGELMKVRGTSFAAPWWRRAWRSSKPRPARNRAARVWPACAVRRSTLARAAATRSTATGWSMERRSPAVKASRLKCDSRMGSDALSHFGAKML
ncbi:S8 family serine peptidase [Hankyongella ginsenosidimutans]|uniref:S8 family serine peptidase n=1 Tax=Hankyongella ginsenosidimutans TaxID=1763828 RepID=UPI001CA3241A|nr:S8 family serine peptidase [Hankyongella ginsenosidimutans]